MKKVLSVMIAAAMVSFVACKGKTEEAAPAVDSSTMAPPVETQPTADEQMMKDSLSKDSGATHMEGEHKEGEKHEEHK